METVNLLFETNLIVRQMTIVQKKTSVYEEVVLKLVVLTFVESMLNVYHKDIKQSAHVLLNIKATHILNAL